MLLKNLFVLQKTGNNYLFNIKQFFKNNIFKLFKFIFKNFLKSPAIIVYYRLVPPP